MNSGNVSIPPQAPPAAADDDKAGNEVAALALGLDPNSVETKDILDNARRNRVAEDNLISRLIRNFMVFASIVLGVSFVVLFWHFVAPSHWLFLEPERVNRLQELLLSGAIGAGVARIGMSRALR